MSDSVLVIGGGIAGVQAALDLAQAGARVVLVERSPSLGGKMAALDKNFPTLDCSICIEAPKLSEVSEHPNIEVITNAEVTALQGEAGAFTATIHRKSGLVTDECTRCDECVQVCPVLLSNEFDAGMASRKAIYTPFPQAVPGPYVIDVANCLNDPPNLLACQRCADVCPPKCIDWTLPLEEDLEREVASVIVAAGYDLLDPTPLTEFGYGTHPDILTSLEFERLLTSAGPTGGEIIKPSNGHHPENIFFVLCVGSRDQRYYKYCSRFCCMYSVKHAFQAIDHGVSDVTALYMDVRAYGKGFDTFFDRTQEMGAKYVRGRPASIVPDGDKIKVRYENTELGSIETQEADMVVLATAVQPPESVGRLAEALGLAVGEDGFLQAEETVAGLIATSRKGVYAAGCASGPKDIPDSVAEGCGAAALALTHLSSHYWAEEEFGEPLPWTDEERVGVFICHCGSNIAGVVDIPQVIDYAGQLGNVVHSDSQMFSCAASTQNQIAQTIRDKNINRVVVAACSPKTHEGIFHRVCMKAGLNPYLLEMVNLRNQDSWVHKSEREAATLKAMDMVSMGVEKSRLLEPLEASLQPMVQRALVIGGGVAGMTAAANLAQQGFDAHLIEREPELGGLLRDITDLSPADLRARSLIEEQRRALDASGAHLHVGTEVEMIGGHIGNFTARLSTGEEIEAGAIILATGSQTYKPTEFGYGSDPSVITNVDLEKSPKVDAEHVTFVGCVGSRLGPQERGGDVGCSRYCCESMIGQALRLRQEGKRVRVLYKDIRTYSRQAEEMYEEAARAGVQFFRYERGLGADEAISYNEGAVVMRDELLGKKLRIPTDLLVLAVGLRPQDESISAQLKVAHSSDGFLLERHPKLGPVEAGSPGIFLAGAAQGPKDVRESVSQGLAAASKAAGLLVKDTIEKEPITSRVDLDKCIICGICVPACPFGAIEMIGKVKTGEIKFIEAACQGCGACAATCNYDAITMPFFTDEQIYAQIDAALAKKAEEKCIVFTCNWCSYAGADQAGIEKVQYPPSARIIRTMCSARVREEFISHSFEKGAGAVLVTGCRLTDNGSDCHYINANEQTKKRFDFVFRKYTRRGIEPERLQLQWISASEGKEFAAKIREMDQVVKSRVSGAAAGV